jgi:hypothetical protein
MSELFTGLQSAIVSGVGVDCLTVILALIAIWVILQGIALIVYTISGYKNGTSGGSSDN